jgi:hypothetical protein
MSHVKIFISWSGERSQAVAQALHEWLPSVMQAVVPWMSSEDIQKGSRWLQDVSDKLSHNDFGIICVTPENRRAEWLLFEAGALSKVIERAAVATILLDLNSADVSGPLAQFHDTKVNKPDFRRLVNTINHRIAVPLFETKLGEAFDLWWPKLESRLDAARRLSHAPHAERPQREILEEVLGYVRAYQHLAPAAVERDQWAVPKWFEDWVRSQSAPPLGAKIGIVVYPRFIAEAERLISQEVCPVHHKPLTFSKTAYPDGRVQANAEGCCPFSLSIVSARLSLFQVRP